MKHILICLAFIVSCFSGYAQEIMSPARVPVPLVPFDIAVGGRASVESYLFSTVQTLEVSFNGQSVVGEYRDRSVTLGIDELVSRGYVRGSAQSFEQIFAQNPIRGVEVVPVNGSYDVSIRVQLYADGVLLFSGYSSVIITEEGGLLRAAPTPVVYYLEPLSVAIGDGARNTSILSAEWYSGNWQVQSPQIPIVDNFAIVPVGVLNSGTLVFTVNERGFTGSIAIDLNGHAVITEASKIDALISRLSNEQGFIRIIRGGFEFPDVVFWESYSVFEDFQPVIMGQYPVIELTPTLVGREVSFFPQARVSGRGGVYYIIPSEIIVRDMLAGTDTTIRPDSDGVFHFKFNGARAHHLLLRFPGVVDSTIPIEN